MVAVQIGDAIFVTSSLRFQHDDKSETVVQPKNDKVEMKRGDKSDIHAERITFSLSRGGPLSFKGETMGEILQPFVESIAKEAVEASTKKKTRLKIFDR